MNMPFEYGVDVGLRRSGFGNLGQKKFLIFEGKPNELKLALSDIAGQDVLIVEDIVDSGKTFSSLKRMLQKHNPKSLKLCALLDKPYRRQEKVSIDYAGFTAPNAYIVGYGLDYKNKYRNLPYIAILDQISAEEEALLYAS